MTKRARDQVVFLRFAPEEKTQLKEKMSEAGYSSFSAYARKMLLNGSVNKVDFSELKQLNHELGNLNRNLHQIVYRAALLNDLHEADYRDIVDNWQKARTLINRYLTRIIRTDGETFKAGGQGNGSHEDSCD